MKLWHEMTYDAAPEAVAEMLADPAFREQVCDAMHVLRRDVTIDGSGAEMVVRIDQTLPGRGIPSFARKIVGEEIQIVRNETWTAVTDADLVIEVPGKPGTMNGTIALVGRGSQTVETVDGEIRVKVPLVGAKLEGLVRDLLLSALRAEHRVGRGWLAG
ncbi:MAG: DUF2505 domain-containing protein [Nocardioidaceae bacterium]